MIIVLSTAQFTKMNDAENDKIKKPETVIFTLFTGKNIQPGRVKNSLKLTVMLLSAVVASAIGR
jgi:hypothetical protein